MLPVPNHHYLQQAALGSHHSTRAIQIHPSGYQGYLLSPDGSFGDSLLLSVSVLLEYKEGLTALTKPHHLAVSLGVFPLSTPSNWYQLVQSPCWERDLLVKVGTSILFAPHVYLTLGWPAISPPPSFPNHTVQHIFLFIGLPEYGIPHPLQSNISLLLPSIAKPFQLHHPGSIPTFPPKSQRT